MTESVQGLERLVALEAAIIERGKQCVVWLTGDPSDADSVSTTEDALKAIDEAHRLGQERNDEANRLRVAFDNLNRERGGYSVDAPRAEPTDQSVGELLLEIADDYKRLLDGRPRTSMTPRLTQRLAAIRAMLTACGGLSVSSAPDGHGAAEPTSWWFIEAPRGSRINEQDGWWCGREAGSDVFSWDVERAVKFRRKADAELVMRAAHMNLDLKATKHVYMGAAPLDVLEAIRQFGNEDITLARLAELLGVNIADVQFLRPLSPPVYRRSDLDERETT